MVSEGLVVSQMGTKSKGMFPAENRLRTGGSIKAFQPTVLRKVLKQGENVNYFVF